MTNHEIARILLHIADILDIQGENPFKVRAYVRAAQTLEGLTYEVSTLADPGQLRELPGIGEAIAKKITELLTTGSLRYYEELKQSPYAKLTDLLRVPGMGPKHVRLVYDQLGVSTIEQLKQAAEQGRLRALPGLGEKSEQKILEGIDQVLRFQERMPLGLVLPQAKAIVERLLEVKEVQQASLAGSLRRMKETVADVDILVASTEPEPVMEAFTHLPEVDRVLSKGSTKSSVVTRDGFQVDVRVVPPESFGAAQHYFTGSKAHNIHIRSLGVDRGLKINEYGVFRGEELVGGATEEEVFAAVGLPWIPPELREDQGEIEAAAEGRLPRLVSQEDLRGDLHVHSDWTDGADTIEAMAAAAQGKGYAYLAICDHSPTVGITNGLTPERLLAQMAEIDALNQRLAAEGNPFRLLKGIEVDIRPDGTLDLPEDLLARLDIVVAAVHTRFTLSVEEMTRRIVRAIENPVVDVLAHPTGRLIGRREAYQVDIDRLIDACRANGKALELNAYPERLDLSDLHCRKAKDKGVKVAISTDAHRQGNLEWMAYGLATARRGWLEPQDVLNCMALGELMGWLKR
ncbi:MAG: DNA polymerase/3'-5' exonuclease PolX [candidate division KSB1 bacterium]|nr:DNA polymerase/3'-5' exonuclease PolX [candidate division KSB1 bacterium]MDZ7386301.1 DNA polymerase/3'-5' exonuclease PolX [candidate division KSB1 bacterium]MDZ7391328.1 DNA polymerase/3'-5' exonuclease PolX [candidate division KSB1 bacterium]MDZ7414130.1 DNA polymerase/3'-5' exonuclease PolX [candidate division KSB1 bacterium]